MRDSWVSSPTLTLALNTRRQGFRHLRLDKSLQRDARVLDPDLNTLTSATLHRSATSSAIPCCLKFCVVIYSYPLVHHLRPPPQVCHHHCLLVTHAREHRNDRIKCIMIFRIEYKFFLKITAKYGPYDRFRLYQHPYRTVTRSQLLYTVRVPVGPVP